MFFIVPVRHVSCRFDVEQNHGHEELQREKNLREKLNRERDMLTGELFTVRQQLQVCVGLNLKRASAKQVITITDLFVLYV